MPTTKSDDPSANVPVLPAEQKTAPVPSPVGGQESADHAGVGSAATPDILGASPDPSRQIAAQAVSGAMEPAATTAQQPNTEEGRDTGADKAAPAEAQTVANAAGAVTLAGTGLIAQATGETSKLQIEPPVALAPGNKTDVLQPSSKAVQKSVGDAVGAKSSDLTNSADSGKVKAADAVGAVAGASSHSTQSNGQGMQHSQPDASQAEVVMQKAVDGGAVQAQAVPMHAAIHEAATAGAPNGPQDAAHPGVARGDAGATPLDGDEPTATSGVNTARLIQTMSETEIRLGMHSAEFGNISIRTSVSQQQMLAQISLDHGDLSQAISSHISWMQAKLGNDYGLQTLIQVNHQGASASGDQGSAQREQRAFAPSVRGESAVVPAELDVGTSAGVLTGTFDGYRLDIRV